MESRRRGGEPPGLAWVMTSGRPTRRTHRFAYSVLVSKDFIPGVRTPEGALRQVRETLREARHAAGRSPEEVADDLRWPLIQLLQVEQGSRPTSMPQVEQMLAYYDFSLEERNQLLRLAHRAGRWFDPQGGEF